MNPEMQELLRAYRAEQANYERGVVAAREYLSNASLPELVTACRFMDLVPMPRAARMLLLLIGTLELLTTMIARIESGDLE